MEVIKLSDLQIKKGFEIGDLKLAVRAMSGNFEEVTITPTKEQQTRLPAVGRDGINKVIVEPIPDEYVDVSDTTAEAGNVEQGKYFHDASGALVEGTKGMDMLQARVDTTHNASYLFYEYLGTHLDFAKNLDLSKADNAKGLFYNCRYLKTIPHYDTSNIKDMTSMYYQCQNVEEIPEHDTSKLEKANGMFSNCYKLKKIWQIDLSRCEDVGSFAYQCQKITELPPLDTRNSKNFYGMCYRCTDLVTIHLLDLRNATATTSATNLIAICNKLENLNLKNVRTNLQIGSGGSWGYLITLESLLNTIKELWDMSSSTTTYKLTMGSANLEKLANVYVRLVDITDEMREADEYIDNKLPFEVCESTDEGAMPIADYAYMKNWQFA